MCKIISFHVVMRRDGERSAQINIDTNMLLFLNDTTIILLDHIIYTKESSYYYDSYMDINLNIYIVIYIQLKEHRKTHGYFM